MSVYFQDVLQCCGAEIVYNFWNNHPDPAVRASGDSLSTDRKHFENIQNAIIRRRKINPVGFSIAILNRAQNRAWSGWMEELGFKSVSQARNGNNSEATIYLWVYAREGT